jgi:hypothetical protein
MIEKEDIIQENAFLTDYLSQNLVLHLQILNGPLLVSIKLRGQKQHYQMPGFENEFQHKDERSFPNEKEV